MSFMGSKGEVISGTLAIAIVAGVAILLTAVFVGDFGNDLKDQGVDKALACKASVAKASQFLRLADRQSFYASCESIKWDVPSLRGDDEENNRKMATFIVNQYEQCWDKFHEGKLAPVAGDVTLIDTRCFICSQFTMPEDAPTLTGIEEAIDWRFTVDERANAFLEDAFFRSENGDPYYGVEDIDLVNGFWKFYQDLTDGDEAQYERLIKSVTPWDITLQPGKTYYIYNAGLVERKGLIFNTMGTYSKLMLGEPAFEPGICSYLHN